MNHFILHYSQKVPRQGMHKPIVSFASFSLLLSLFLLSLQG